MPKTTGYGWLTLVVEIVMTQAVLPLEIHAISYQEPIPVLFTPICGPGTLQPMYGLP